MVRGPRVQHVPSQKGHIERRTRASKPKVRTGCRTCKKRRLKCGEERPICLKCSSGGFVCDGYEDESEQNEQDTIRIPNTSKVQTQLNQQLWRPIAADIDATHTERLLFHTFRIAATTDETSGLECPFVPFFSRVCPQVSHHEASVKHAMIALGSAYKFLQLSNTEANRGDTLERWNIVTIDQYIKSMSQLQKYTGEQRQGNVIFTLICCLSFICLEILRDNRTVAYTHLQNGLNIIDSLPPFLFRFLNSPVATAGQTKAELQDTIRVFGRIEMFGCFYSPGFRPVVAMKAYNSRRLYDGSDMETLHNREEAHFHAINYFRDIVSRCYETSAHFGDATFWSQSEEQKQQQALVIRAINLAALFQKLAEVPDAPEPGSNSFFCIQLDQLNICCAKILLERMDDCHLLDSMRLNSPGFPTLSELRQQLNALVTFIRPYAASIPSKKLNFGFAHDADIVGPLYYIAVRCGDCSVKNKAGALLYEVNKFRGGFWDDTAIQKVVKIAMEVIS